MATAELAEQSIRELGEEVIALRTELAIVRRDWAAFLLQLAHDHPRRKWSTDLEECWIDDDTAILMVRHKGYPLGQCSRCLKRAPLQNGVCSWSCTGTDAEVTA